MLLFTLLRNGNLERVVNRLVSTGHQDERSEKISVKVSQESAP